MNIQLKSMIILQMNRKKVGSFKVIKILYHKIQITYQGFHCKCKYKIVMDLKIRRILTMTSVPLPRSNNLLEKFQIAWVSLVHKLLATPIIYRPLLKLHRANAKTLWVVYLAINWKSTHLSKLEWTQYKHKGKNSSINNSRILINKRH